MQLCHSYCTWCRGTYIAVVELMDDCHLTLVGNELRKQMEKRVRGRSSQSEAGDRHTETQKHRQMNTPTHGQMDG